jgi:type II secretory ATPase GspE/PulE/Tfp pilus assembly ATPase PilB-like protein
MELFINKVGELDISNSQKRLLKQLTIMQPNDLILVDGACGSGKSFSSLFML